MMSFCFVKCSFFYFSPNGLIKKEKFVKVYDQFYSDGKSSDFYRFTLGLFDREDAGTSNNELELNFLELTSFFFD